MNSPSSSFVDKSILSYPPMELTEEQRKQFLSMWEIVPDENTLYLPRKEFDELVEKLNNPPAPNERLIKLMTEKSVLEKVRDGEEPTLKAMFDKIAKLKEVADAHTGVPRELTTIDSIETVDVSGCEPIIDKMQELQRALIRRHEMSKSDDTYKSDTTDDRGTT